MKTRFIKSVAKIFLIALPVIASSNKITAQSPVAQMYYEIKLYRINGAAQAGAMDVFLKDAFIPAVHRAGIATVGVFKPIESDTAFGKLVYVFIPYKTITEYAELITKLEKDPVYQSTGKTFLDAPFNEPPFERYESILAKAFAFMPRFKVYKYSTPPSERIYEYRSYESATEAKALKKIKMFNEGGEIKIFEEAGSNAVFYAQVLMGSQRPRLIYMTTYADMKSHDEKWVAFRNHPEWKRISSLDEYKNSTSKTKPYLLHPTSYSDF
jgi:hypothetical protein